MITRDRGTTLFKVEHTVFNLLLNKPLKLGGARAPPVPRYLDMIEIVKDQRSKNGMENLVG